MADTFSVLVGGHGAPFRAPCNGWRPVQTSPCFQHTKNNEKNLPEWKNVTTVPDWRDPSDKLYQPQGIPPYPRKSDGGAIHLQDGTCIDSGGTDPMWPADDGSGDCPGPCGSPCNTSKPGQQLCNTWFANGPGAPTPYNQCHIPDSTHFTTNYNCYQSTGLTVDHSKCRKIGFKNVQARKNWHGAFGYDSQERGVSWNPAFPSNTCPPCGCTYEPMRPVPDQTKYLTQQIVAKQVNTLNGVTTSFADITVTCDVGRYTGTSAITSCTQDSSDPTTLANLQSFLGGVTLNIFTPVEMAAYSKTFVGLFVTAGTVSSTITGCEPVYSCKSIDVPSGDKLATLDLNITAGTFAYKDYAIGNILLTSETINVGSTSTNWTRDTYSSDGTEHVRVEITATLLNPYTAQDCYNDCRDLLKFWQLDDDALYPWRVDEYVGVAPLVSYDEDPATQPGFINTCPNALPYYISGQGRTGNILGKPLQQPGAGPHFDWSHLTYRACNSGGGDDQHYIYAHGAWAHNAPPSPIPAYTLDQTTLRKIKDYSESAGVITIITESATSIQDLDLCVVCGGFPFDGAYYIEKVDTTHFKLHTQNDGIGHFRIILDVDSPPVPSQCAQGIVAKATLNSDATYYYVGDETDLAMPQSATQWTQNWESGFVKAGDIPAGASMIFKNGTLYMQKWAEIKVPRPSINFARPCGIDRYQINHDVYKCVQSLQVNNPGQSNQSVDVTVLDTLGFNNGDKVICCMAGASPSPNGIYSLTSNSPTSVHLSNFQPLSPHFTPDADACNALGIVAKLRYPTAPPICQQLTVLDATNETPVVITVDKPSYLADNDTVVISGVLGNTGANGTFQIKTHSSTVFELTGAVATGKYTSGGTVSSPTTAQLGWYDDQPKGEFAYSFFNFNYRDAAEADRVCAQYHTFCNSCAPATPPDTVNCIQVNGNWQSDVRVTQGNNGLDRGVNLFKYYQSCLNFDRCEPQVMACLEEHATETFTGKPAKLIYMLPYGASLDPDGDTVSFFPDERYGARWQAFFLQHVTDPFWEQPIKPCFADEFTNTNIPSLCSQSEDDGSCKTDTCLGDLSGITYFAHEPLVENRVDPPAGAPALPTGIHLGYLTWFQLQFPGPSGNLLLPPVGTGYAPEVGGVDPAIPIPAATPWGLAIREFTCVCSGGVFATDYTENLAKYNC